jgi:hypothetical protein
MRLDWQWPAVRSHRWLVVCKLLFNSPFVSDTARQRDLTERA